MDSMLKQKSEKFSDEHGVQDIGRDVQASISRVSMESNTMDAMLHNRLIRELKHKMDYN